MGTSIGKEWESNATLMWGIPLHPKGEVSIESFVLADPNDVQLVRERIHGLYCQLLFNVTLAYIFMRNFHISIKMVIKRVKTLPGWCCLIPSIFGMSIGILAIVSLLPVNLSCREIAWYVGFAITFCLLCNNIIVLQKAYLALCRPRWVLIVGALLMIPQLGYVCAAWLLSPVTLTSQSGCTVHYPDFLPVYWFGSILPLNMLFSTVFSYVAYKQYKAYGSKAWKRMARDGIQTMCLVVACSITCGLIIMFHLGGDLSEMFFLVDRLVTSTILVNHCCSMRRIADESRNESNSSSRRRQQDNDWTSISLLTKNTIHNRME
ncbi:hypothetical protein BDF22DRAFT_695171 [Syncephalis plumigaleata]|nr:hypothetical protein BDF22DRAFT_695171 [Syncephalis plumigaleata]